MLDELNGDNKPKVLDEKTITKQLFRDIHARLPEIPVKDLVRGFAVSTRTGFNWLSEDKQEKSGATDEASAGRIDYINNLIDKGENVDGDAEDEPTQSNRREVNNA
jgi:hypothetical protein